MGLQEQKIESLPFVTAELNYLAPTPGKRSQRTCRWIAKALPWCGIRPW